MFLYLFFTTVVLQIVWLPFYVDFGFKKIPYTPQKMICSTLFLLGGIFAVIYSGSPNWYSRLIIIAFVFSWIGDLALAKNSTGWRFVTGLSAFLIAHICYIVSFYYAGKILFSETKFISLYEAVGLAVVFIILLRLKSKLQIKFGSLAAPVALYALAICTMLIKAVSTGMRALMLHSANAYAIFTLFLLAAVLFVISDAVLVLILFKNKYSQLTEGINIVTYYIAQMLFAGSIILVNSSAPFIS